MAVIFHPSWTKEGKWYRHFTWLMARSIRMNHSINYNRLIDRNPTSLSLRLSRYRLWEWHVLRWLSSPSWRNVFGEKNLTITDALFGFRIQKQTKKLIVTSLEFETKLFFFSVTCINIFDVIERHFGEVTPNIDIDLNLRQWIHYPSGGGGGGDKMRSLEERNKTSVFVSKCTFPSYLVNKFVVVVFPQKQEICGSKTWSLSAATIDTIFSLIFSRYSKISIVDLENKQQNSSRREIFFTQ